jgi:hypothetical protein
MAEVSPFAVAAGVGAATAGADVGAGRWTGVVEVVDEVDEVDDVVVEGGASVVVVGVAWVTGDDGRVVGTACAPAGTTPWMAIEAIAMSTARIRRVGTDGTMRREACACLARPCAGLLGEADRTARKRPGAYRDGRRPGVSLRVGLAHEAV